MKRQGVRLEVVGPANDASMSSWRLEAIDQKGEWSLVRHGVGSSFVVCLTEANKVLKHELESRTGPTSPDLGVVAPNCGRSDDEIPFASSESIHQAPAGVTG